MDYLNKCKDILIKYENIIFAYIFGSYIQEKLKEDSDLDIAIYLKKDLDLETYLEIKMDLMEACKREIDLVILNDAVPLLKYEVYRNSILLFTRDKAIETEYKVKTLFEYNDIKRYLNLSYNKNIDRLKREVARSDG